MPALRELQELFLQAVAGGEVAPALRGLITATPALAADARVGIYAGMYHARIVETLAEDFPRLAAVAGEDGFAALVRACLARHPSTHPSIARLGAALPGFLDAGLPPSLPGCAADLARLEWARRDVFDAPDVEPLRLAALRAVAPEDWPALRLTPVPACTTLVLGWPAQVLWAAENGPPPALAPARTALRVWRDGFAVYHAVVAPAEEAALARLAGGTTFGDLCDGFDRPDDAAALLLRWIEDGIVRAGTDPDAGADPYV